MSFTVLSVLLFLLFSGNNSFGFVSLAWENFEGFSTVVKKIDPYYAKVQPVGDMVEPDSATLLSLTGYERLLYDIYLDRQDISRPLIDIMAGLNYNDGFNYWLFGGFRYENRHFRASIGYQLDSRFDDDTLFISGIGNPDRAFRARMNEAEFSLKFREKWRVGFERQNANWGYYSTMSPILSNNPFSYDVINMRYLGDIFRFHIFTGALSRSRDADGSTIYRRLYGKHLNFVFDVGDFTFSPGLMEIMMEPNDSDVFRLLNFYPFAPAFLNRMNTEARGNCVIAADLLVKYRNMLNFYAQFTLDDWQIDDELATDAEPNLWAIATSLDYFSPFSFGVGFDYTRVSPWMYHANYDTSRTLVHFRRPIGFRTNNIDEGKVRLWYDFDNFRVFSNIKYSRQGMQTFLLDTNTFYWRNYEHLIGQEFPLPGIDPTRGVERTLDVSAGFLYSIYGRLSVGYQRVENANNILGEYDNRFYADITLFPQYSFRIPDIFR